MVIKSCKGTGGGYDNYYGKWTMLYWQYQHTNVLENSCLTLDIKMSNVLNSKVWLSWSFLLVSSFLVSINSKLK